MLLPLIAVPLATSLVLIAVPSRYPNLVRYIVGGGGRLPVRPDRCTSSSPSSSATVTSVIQFEVRWPWLENVGFLGKDGITFHLGVDGISAPMVLLNGIVAFTGVLISWKIDYRNKDFFVLFFALVAGVFGTFISLDLFFFFFFYELAVLPMFLLIAVWGASSRFPTFVRTKEYGAMKLTLYLVAASVLIFVGIFAIFVKADIGTFDLPALYNVQFSESFQKAVFPVFVIGCGVLAGLWPFHTWSPDGHVAAPTAVSMLHAGVLMKLGAFGIIRLGIQLLPRGRGVLDAGPDGAGRRSTSSTAPSRRWPSATSSTWSATPASATWATCSWAWRR